MSAIEHVSSSRAISRTVGAGVIAGMVAGAVMATYAMLASVTFLHQGVFTPLYGIASPISGQSAMMASMKQGVYFAAGPALAGLIVHMMWSAMFGVLFGLLAQRVQLRGAQALATGVIFGLAIELVMAVVILPSVNLGSMPSAIGLPSFTIEHVLFGLTLGAWALRWPRHAGASR